MEKLSGLFVIVAAYNEEKSIKEVIKNLFLITDNIVIVDDGSIDKTFEIATNYKCNVIKHSYNLGQGAAIRSGVNFCLENNAKYIATFDADGQHNVEDLYKMFKIIYNSNIDVILGSRFLGSAPGIPLKRIILLKFGIFFTFLFSGVKLTDVHNGLRIFSNNAAKLIDFSADDMTHASLIIDSIVKNRLYYKEVAVTIKYTTYSKMKGQRLFDIVRTGLRIILKKIF